MKKRFLQNENRCARLVLLGSLSSNEAAATKASLENKHLTNSDYFVIIASSSNPLLFERARSKWTGRSAFEVNVENERFTVVCVHVVVKPLNLEISRCHLVDYIKELY